MYIIISIFIFIYKMHNINIRILHMHFDKYHIVLIFQFQYSNRKLFHLISKIIYYLQNLFYTVIVKVILLSIFITNTGSFIYFHNVNGV